jgi:aminoglycoside/choline kinase family phosphotransferase
MVEVSRLQSILTSYKIEAEKLAVAPLAGDASNRKYYRVSWKHSGNVRSLILMVLAEPENFKASEEAVSPHPPPVTELPFINIQRHLYACGVSVPTILHYDAEKGWILLEDLGDITLAHEIMKHPLDAEPVSALYQKAINELIRIQREATFKTAITSLAHYRSFDQSLFMWEFDHFIEYGIEKREGVTLPDKRKQAIRAFFSDMALRLATLPPVFTHRDYHSRNLMVQYQGNTSAHIRVIDFQDALMGPCQYDLASLLRDSYIDLPDPVINHLISYYLGQWEEQTGEKISKDSFCEMFDWVSIQRNLKAAGRFVYIDQVKKNPHYLPFVSATLLKVKRNLEKDKRLTPLRDLLSEYVKELQ